MSTAVAATQAGGFTITDAPNAVMATSVPTQLASALDDWLEHKVSRRQSVRLRSDTPSTGSTHTGCDHCSELATASQVDAVSEGVTPTPSVPARDSKTSDVGARERTQRDTTPAQVFAAVDHPSGTPASAAVVGRSGQVHLPSASQEDKKQSES